MPKISRKIVQSLINAGKKGLINLERAQNAVGYQPRPNSLVDEIEWMIQNKKHPNILDRTKSKVRNYYNKKINQIKNRVLTYKQLEQLREFDMSFPSNTNHLFDIGVIKATKTLLDKKIITPSQAKRVNEAVWRNVYDSSYEPRDTRGLQQGWKARYELAESLPTFYSDFDGRRDKFLGEYKETPGIGLTPPRHKNLTYAQFMDEYDQFMNDNADRVNRLDRRLDQKNKAVKTLARRYAMARNVAQKLGTAGLIGAGVAGAKALAPKEEPKSNSSGVKKMANRSNKYFS